MCVCGCVDRYHSCLILSVSIFAWLHVRIRMCECAWEFSVASENVTNVHEWKQWGIPSNVAGPGDNSAFQLLPIYFIAAALSSHPGQDEKHRCVKKLKWKSFWTQQDGGMGVLSMTQWHFPGIRSNSGRKISLYGHLLSSALSQDHKLFWVTGLGTRREECTQLPADI